MGSFSVWFSPLLPIHVLGWRAGPNDAVCILSSLGCPCLSLGLFLFPCCSPSNALDGEQAKRCGLHPNKKFAATRSTIKTLIVSPCDFPFFFLECCILWPTGRCKPGKTVLNLCFRVVEHMLTVVYSLSGSFSIYVWLVEHMLTSVYSPVFPSSDSSHLSVCSCLSTIISSQSLLDFDVFSLPVFCPAKLGQTDSLNNLG